MLLWKVEYPISNLNGFWYELSFKLKENYKKTLKSGLKDKYEYHVEGKSANQ